MVMTDIMVTIRHACLAVALNKKRQFQEFKPLGIQHILTKVILACKDLCLAVLTKPLLTQSSNVAISSLGLLGHGHKETTSWRE